MMGFPDVGAVPCCIRRYFRPSTASCKCGGRQDEVLRLLVTSKTQFNMARRCSPHSHVEMGFGSRRWLWRERVDDGYKNPWLGKTH